MSVERKTAVAFPDTIPLDLELWLLGIWLGWILAILPVPCCPSARGAGRSVLPRLPRNRYERQAMATDLGNERLRAELRWHDEAEVPPTPASPASPSLKAAL